jgi:tetratricopeptide (TPR) repeat protein
VQQVAVASWEVFVGKSLISASFLWVLAQIAGTSAEPANTSRLSLAARLPRVSFASGVESTDFVVRGDAPDDPGPEIAAVQNALVGNESDAERNQTLAALYDRAKDKARCREARERASELFSQRLKARPDDSLSVSRLGVVLVALGQQREGEALLRRAVQLPTHEWECWANLCDYLGEKGNKEEASALLRRARELHPRAWQLWRTSWWHLYYSAWQELVVSLPNLPEKCFSPFSPFFQAAALFKEQRPSPMAVAKALALLEDGERCLDHGVAAAPTEGEPYRWRAEGQVLHALMRAEIRQAAGEKVNFYGEVTSAGILEDFARAAQLLPGDYTIQLKAIMFAAKYGDEHSCPPVPGWRGSATARLVIEAGVTRLEALTKSVDSSVAYGSCSSLGLVYLEILNDTERAEGHLRRALALIPSREPAWELLCGLLSQASRGEDLLTVCRERLRYKDSAHNRFLLAKAYELMARYDHAEEQLRVAMKLDCKDLMATLGLAALLLRHSHDVGALAEAGGLLDRVAPRLAEVATPEFGLDYLATRGIYVGSKGDTAQASRLFRQVLEQDANHRIASDALRALGE